MQAWQKTHIFYGIRLAFSKSAHIFIDYIGVLFAILAQL